MIPSLSDIQFSDPAWLDALWGLPVIVALYLMRRRTARVFVPHLPIWEGVLERMRSRSRWLRTLLSILLQLLIFTTAVLLLAGPYAERDVGGEGHTVIVVDRSLGVRVRGAGGAPVSEAVLEQARELISQAVASGSASLAFLQDGVRARVTATRDPERLFAALDDPGAARGRRDWDAVAALRVAVGPTSRIVVVTPFAPDPGLGEALRDAQVLVVRAGTPQPQAGVVGVHREADGVKVRVDGSGPERQLVLRRDGVVLTDVRVKPGAEVWIRIPADAGSSPDLVLEPEDGFPEDDRVPLVLPERQRIRVLVVTDTPTPWLDAWFKASAVIDVAGSSRTRSTQFREWVDDYDVTILVDDQQELPLPRGRYVLLASGAPDLPIARDVRRIGASEPVKTRREDPLVRALDLSRWEIEKVARTRARAGLEVVVDGSTGPLISRGSTDEVKFVDIAVRPDPASSTLPLLAAFPLMLEAALVELVAREREAGPPVLAAGGTLALLPGEEPVLYTPGGAALPPLAELPDATGYRLPERPGRYWLGDSDDARRIAVALLDHPGRPMEPPAGAQSLPGFPERTVRASLRWALLWVLAAALGLEWWLWQLRGTD
ncbi:MAG: BatA domain-containing protein [Planctomycetota bacterium]|nr:BatA domain-containing protein [Planctomycetota bacterium]